MTVAELWNAGIPVKGTPAGCFLGGAGIKVAPASVVRYHSGLGFRQGAIAAPALLIALARWPEKSPCALIGVPLADDGLAHAVLRAEIWADTSAAITGAAVQVGRPGNTLQLVVGGFDALGFAWETGLATWGALHRDALPGLALPPSVTALIVADDNPPPPAAVLKWQRERRSVEWRGDMRRAA